jgi:hypothetical protein
LNLRAELGKTFGVTPDEMYKLMGKRGLAPSQIIAALEKAGVISEMVSGAI